jgi:hypothetical protein
MFGMKVTGLAGGVYRCRGGARESGISGLNDIHLAAPPAPLANTALHSLTLEGPEGGGFQPVDLRGGEGGGGLELTVGSEVRPNPKLRTLNAKL